MNLQMNLSYTRVRVIVFTSFSQTYYTFQKSLLNAMETKENQLSEEEQTRNKHGPMQIYTYTPERLGKHMLIIQ